MPLDFEAIKKIRIVDVVAGHYHLPLRFRGDFANARCPLPTHKDGDKGKNFSINIPDNYWRCFSESCNANNNGKRGGDVINFVASMENCREKEAAQKLSDWYGIGKEKPAPQIGKRVDVPHIETHHKEQQEPSIASGSVKYMAEIDAWYDITFKRLDSEADDAYRKRTLNAIKGKLVESYRNGKAAV